MISSNDITGDLIASKVTSEAFKEGHERIWGKKTKPDPVAEALASPQQITHVAIKYANKVFSLPRPNRHHDVIRMIGGIYGEDIQGFLDANGVFLTRKQAFYIAKASGQLNRNPDPKHYQGDELFSEDLW
jgi:hypothetical protein